MGRMSRWGRRIYYNGNFFCGLAEMIMKKEIDHHHYAHLSLNEGAYFFEKRDMVINNSVVSGLFDRVADDAKVMERRYRIRESGLPHAGTVLCSLLVFSYKSDPTFVDYGQNSSPEELVEKKVGYLLMIEIGDYVVFIKKNAYHMTSFVNQLTPISGEKLSGILISGRGTTYQQVRMANMSTNANAMRNKTFEAEDLESTMAMFNANNSIITNVRLDDQLNGVCTLSVSTSRLSKFGAKKDIRNTLLWVDRIVDALDNYQPTDNFLKRFALPVTWKNEKVHLTPVSLLINKQELLNYVGHNPTFYRLENGQPTALSDDEQRRLLRFMGQTYMLKQIGDKDYACHLLDRLHLFTRTTGIGLTGQGVVNSILYEKEGGKYEKLITLINSLSCFTVSFDDYQYMYYGRRLYKNGQIAKDIEAIKSTLKPLRALKTSSSEKGDNYTINDTEFHRNCVFRIVEDEFAASTCLVCDDLGNEWADHIAINGDTVSFIHSKSNNKAGKTTLSASHFQDAIGQALKNIGYLNPTDAFLTAKRRNIENAKYTLDRQHTSILKVRKGTAQQFVDEIKRLRASPNYTREVCLAVDFLSRQELIDAFDKIVAGIPFRQKNYTVQLLWLLNAFISACKDADLHCKIYCCE